MHMHALMMMIGQPSVTYMIRSVTHLHLVRHDMSTPEFNIPKLMIF